MILLSITGFLGKAHPLVVHLPIGFILIALVSEWFFVSKEDESRKNLINYMWLLSFLATLAAAICGLLLANTGHYKSSTLTIHQWTGIALTVFTLGLYLHKTNVLSLHSKASLILKTAVVALLFISGHNGGKLTHGASYMNEYLPFASDKGIDKPDLSVYELDSIAIFSHVVQPILNQHCVRCHTNGDSRGGLNLSSYDEIIAEASKSRLLEAGVSGKSDLFKRMTLSRDDERFMPPSGTSPTFKDIRVIQWWIDSGAKNEKGVSAEGIPSDIKSILSSEYGLDFVVRPFIEKKEVAFVNDDIITGLEDQNFNVSRIAATTNFIDISRIGMPKEISDKELESLQNVMEQIAWLDLSGTDIKGEMLRYIEDFPHVTRLKLQNTDINDEGLKYIANYENLTYLNLYNTEVTDAGLEHLKDLKKLKNLYLWQTSVSEEGRNNLSQALPELQIVAGIN